MLYSRDMYSGNLGTNNVQGFVFEKAVFYIFDVDVIVDVVRTNVHTDIQSSQLSHKQETK